MILLNGKHNLLGQFSSVYLLAASITEMFRLKSERIRKMEPRSTLTKFQTSSTWISNENCA